LDDEPALLSKKGLVKNYQVPKIQTTDGLRSPHILPTHPINP